MTCVILCSTVFPTSGQNAKSPGSVKLGFPQPNSPALAPALSPQLGPRGERESHPTTQVAFNYDTGMYRASQAVLIYYDFRKPTPAPNPFPGLSYAPEMPAIGMRD